MMASLTMARFHSSPNRPRAMALEFSVTGTPYGIAVIFRLRQVVGQFASDVQVIGVVLEALRPPASDVL
jgi:hypothetical protein